MHPWNRQHGLQQQLEQRFTFLHLQEHNLKPQQPKEGHKSCGNLQHFRWYIFFKQLQLLPSHLELDGGLQAHLWGRQPLKQQIHARLKRHFPLLDIYSYTHTYRLRGAKILSGTSKLCYDDDDICLEKLCVWGFQQFSFFLSYFERIKKYVRDYD